MQEMSQTQGLLSEGRVSYLLALISMQQKKEKEATETLANIINDVKSNGVLSTCG